MKFCKYSAIFLLGVLALPLGANAVTRPDLSLNLSGTTTEGYCNARLAWVVKENKAGDGTYRILTSDVYRNDVRIKSESPWSNYIDDNLAVGVAKYKVTAKIEQTYSVTENSVKKSVVDTFAIASNEIQLNIRARNAAKVKYRIEEVYNLRLGAENKANSYDGKSYVPSATDKNSKLPVFTQPDFVRGCYHIISKRDGKGYWFFVSNGFGSWGQWLGSGKFAENVVGYKYNDKWCEKYTKVYRVPDDAASLCDASKYKLVLNVSREATSPEFIYIGVDEYENIFCRSGVAFSETMTSYSIYKYDNYVNNVNATPWKTGSLTKNLAELSTSGTSGQLGRCDQLTVKGLLDTGDCSIMLSPGKGPYCFRLKLKNGEKVSESWAMPQFEDETAKNNCKNAENDCVFVDGVDDIDRVVYQHRSNFYSVLDLNKSGSGDITSSSNGKIIDYISALGQVQQSGSATLYFKGTAANGVQCNDMFIASSMGFGSIASGSFQVNIAGCDVDKTLATAKDFNFTSGMAPLGTFAQREEYLSGNANNANLSAMFFTKEQEGTTGKYHLYLYQYVPLYRIAKYEIIPQIGAAETPIKITIDKVETPSTGIVGFDNNMTFHKPAYGESSTDDYEIKGYKVILTDPLGNYYVYQIGAKAQDKDGKTVYYCNICQANQDGTVKTDKNGNPLPVQKYDDKGYPVVDSKGNPVYYDKYIELPSDYTGNIGDFVQDFELPFPITSLGDYTATISVWVGRKGMDEYIECEPSTSTIPVTLETRVPEVDTKTYRYDGDKDENKGSMLSSNGDHPYRIDGSFEMPTGPDPVSYYEVWIDKNDGRGPQKFTIDPYDCYVRDAEGNIIIDASGNKTTGNPDTRADEKRGFWVIEDGVPTTPTNTKAPGQCPQYNNGTREATDKIPGDYDFDNDPGYATSGGEKAGEKSNTIFSIYLEAPDVDTEGKTEEQIKQEQNDIVKDYKICVKPVYAAGTAFETRTNGCGSAGIPGTTGIDNVETEGSVMLYPVPAETDVTVVAPFAIEEVKFFSVSGSVVKVVKFDGNENEVSIAVEDLTSGFYYVSINGKTSQKFIKR